MSNFKISVIMAVYNVGDYIEQAINSVINQSISFKDNIQLIMVNDGSTDMSGQICKKYQELYPDNIIYIEKQNTGVSETRNLGLKYATGTYINFLDSDDYFSENAFDDVIKTFKKYGNQTDVVAIKLINFENSEGSWVNKDYFEKDQLIDMQNESNFMQCQVGASFIRKTAIGDLEFDKTIKIHEDTKFIYTIFANKPKCATVATSIYWHRIRFKKNSATQTIKDKENIYNLTNKVFMYLEKLFIEKNGFLPDFVQTLILLEFNYYVVKKIRDCQYTKKEKKEIKRDIRKLLSNINKQNIEEHFVLVQDDKEKLIQIKGNINKIFWTQKNRKNVIKRKIKQIANLPIKIIKYLPRKMKNRILYSTRLELEEVNNRINVIDKNKIDKSEFIDLISDIEEYKKKSDNQQLETSKNIEMKIYDMQNELKNLKSELLDTQNNIGFDKEEKVDYCLYFHGGSRNHGCEALVKTICTNLNAERSKILVNTFRKSEDVLYNIGKYAKYIVEPRVTDLNSPIKYMGETRFNYEDLGLKGIKSHFNKNTVAISIGGDNYCYEEEVRDLLAQYNNNFEKLNIKTALIGCSIEPELLKSQKILDDLNKYSLILAREKLTYNALLDAGINKNTHLVPDTAFKLTTKHVILPDVFIPNNTIGINISPIVENSNNGESIVLENYKEMMEYIINNTTYNIALIPHVCWNGCNDLDVLEKLYNQYKITNRVVLIPEYSAEELKYVISKCKYFIGARTHATIAAYSTYVPTLVVGYSIKSKGIANDLFGTYKNYVISINDIKDKECLVDAFKWLDNNSSSIKERLLSVIPEYVKEISKMPKYFEELKKSEIFKSLPKEQCTGCSACYNICSAKAISMEENSEGFLYPKIDYTKCSNCNLCKKVCPQNKKRESVVPKKIIAARTINEAERLNSSSGGIFYELARYTILLGGYVYGCTFGENKKLEHIEINKLNDIVRLQGSKYAQSDCKKVYEDVKTRLTQGKQVLFIGTPCQIEGLRGFLQKEYQNLLLVDFICHGVPSDKILQMYCGVLEKRYNSKIVKYNFRKKSNGWTNFKTNIEFENGKIYENDYSKDPYMKGFLRNLYLRESCYNCNSKNFKSKSDITIGDFWGIDDKYSDFNDDKGCSIVCINTLSGEKVINNISENLKYIDISLNDVIKNNRALVESFEKSEKRKKFFDQVFDNTDELEDIIEKNLY